MSKPLPRGLKIQAWSGVIAALLVAALFIVKPQFSRHEFSELEKIQQRGYIKILTLNSASTYYQDDYGPNGFEYQLAQLFSDFIGVNAEFITVEQFSDLYRELLFGTGDIVAAGLSENESEFSDSVAYGPRYLETTNQVLYRRGSVDSPSEISDLFERNLQVIRGTTQARLLRDLQQQHPDLAWTEVDNIASEELIEKVDTGDVEFILADSNAIALQRRFFPELRVAFELGKPRQLRWAYNVARDDSLETAIAEFFDQIKGDGRLEQLVHRHYSHVAKFNYSDIQTFTGHIRERLPKYEALFRREADRLDLDWRLLAAVGYQESLWNARAKSPTGVRGLMMLTLITAKQMKVQNRLDPAQSVRGGAKYLSSVFKRIPDQVSDPDRTWLALAAYNVGLGHVEDARKLTEQNGGDPNRWIDVKKTLPLLARKKWYKDTRYGYARGWEPVTYVENIRKYYEYLVVSDLKANRDTIVLDKSSIVESTPLGPSL